MKWGIPWFPQAFGVVNLSQALGWRGLWRQLYYDDLTQQVQGLRILRNELFAIQRAGPELAGRLTDIAFSAKRHWGYPEVWIQYWAPLLTITPVMFQRQEIFTASVNGEVVAFSALSFQGKRACLEHLWVLPGFMGRGIGTDLFRHALARCKEMGVQVLEIESDPNAQFFYERMGAQKTGENVTMLDGHPRVLPVLEIPI